jgi:hypothetical protein
MLSSKWFGFTDQLHIDLQRIIAAACPATAAH